MQTDQYVFQFVTKAREVEVIEYAQKLIEWSERLFGLCEMAINPKNFPINWNIKVLTQPVQVNLDWWHEAGLILIGYQSDY